MTEDPRIDPADLRNVRFPGSSRRYDARSVDQFLETVAARIAATNDLVDRLQARIAELDAAGPVAAPAPPPPQLAHLDDDELVRLVGEETTSVLSTARRAADEIRSKAEEAAARMVREATAEADRVTAESKATAADLTRQAEEALESATADAAGEATRIREEAAAEAAETRAQATELADAELAAAEARRAETDAEVDRILEAAREEGRGMVQEAKEVRSRVLEDLQRRRDTARDHIERLLAGRERLLAAYGLVRENLDDITSQLADSLPDPGPELPDGFVGIVGSSAPAVEDDAADIDDGEPEVADAAGDGDRPDDTVAPRTATETEADIASDARPAMADPDAEDDGDVAAAGPSELGSADPVADEAAQDASDDGVGDAEDGASEESSLDDAPIVHGADPEGAAEDSLTADLADPALLDDAEGVESVDSADAPAAGIHVGDDDAALADAPAAGIHVGDDDAAVDDEPVGPDAAIEEPGAESEADGSGDEEPPTELEADEAEGDARGSGGDVDELFARLRAEREQSVAKARAVVAAEPVVEVPAPDAGPEHLDASTAAEPGDDPAGGDDTASTRDARNDVDRVPVEFLAGEAALTARAEVLGPLDAALNRALKRRLADEQNELLDLLRRSGATTADELLPDLATQVEGYARVAEEHLLGAAIAGGEMAGGLDDVDVSGLADDVGAALVEPFRRRVERSAAEVDDPDELDERLRALYREWKVQHIGPVAEDALLSAYALGTLRAAEPDRPVRWSIDPGQGPCPDAQDNALAGAVAAGEAFATGDVCPQAHPGCRCLLVLD